MMMRKVTWGLFLLVFSNGIFCQEDLNNSQILQFENSKSTIISKGRRILLDHLIAGDFEKVKEMKNYLIEIEDDNYFAFYPAEYWFVLHWTRDYWELAAAILNFDSINDASYATRIPPMDDMFYFRLKEISLKHEPKLKGQLDMSFLGAETKELLLMHLEWLFIEDRNDIFAQDHLNELADTFLKTYTNSLYGPFIKEHIRYRLKAKNLFMAYDFFGGYGVFTGNLRNNFSNNFAIGHGFDICYKKYELHLRNYIAFNKTKRDITYSLGTFESGARTMVFLPEVALGYAVYDSKSFKLSPFAGIAAMDIGPALSDLEATPELGELNLDYTRTYSLGFQFDIKLVSKKVPNYNPVGSYGFIRVRYSYCMPSFERKYEDMSGNMHYLTIGFGFVDRGLKRIY
jgi:hypothetical protein